MDARHTKERSIEERVKCAIVQVIRMKYRFVVASHRKQRIPKEIILRFTR